MAGTAARAAMGVGIVLLAIVVAPLPGAASGIVLVSAPQSGERFRAGDQFAVVGRVVNQNGTPLPGVLVTVSLLDLDATTLSAASEVTAGDGSFVIEVPVPHSARTGTYSLRVDADDPTVQGVQLPIRIQAASEPPGAVAWVLLAGGTAFAVLAVLGLLRRAGRRPAPRGPPEP